MNENSIAHTKWNCKYHIVFTPKYRRKAIYVELKKEIGAILRELSNWKEVEIIEAHGCVYCYANYSQESVKTNCLKHNKNSKLLLGEIEKEDEIHEREVKSLKDLQTSFFN